MYRRIGTEGAGFHVERKKPVLGYVLIANIIIGALLLSLLSYVLYRQFERNSIEDINEISMRNLSKTQVAADLLLRDVHRTFFSLKEYNALIFDALYGTSFSSAAKIDIVKTLKIGVGGYDFVHSAYVYNAQIDTVFSTTAQAVSAAGEFFDREIIDHLREADLKSERLYTPRALHTTTGTLTEDVPVLTMIFTEPSQARRPNSALIVNIHQKLLQSLIEVGEGHLTIIADKDGLCLSHSNPAYFGQNLMDESFVAQVLSAREESGSFTATIDGEKSLISFVKAPRMGWHLISVSEYARLFERVSAFQNYMLVTTALFILLALFTAALLTWRIKTPFDKLWADLRGLLPVKKNETLKRLLTGEFADSSLFEAELRAIGVHFSKPYFSVCVLLFDSFAQLCMQASSEDLTTIRYALIRSLSERLRGVEVRGDHIGVIINHDGSGPPGACIGALEQARDSIKKPSGITFTIGVSAAVNGLDQVPHAYERAIRAAEYRVRLGKGRIIYERDYDFDADAPYEYPFSTEKGLIDALRSGDLDEMAIQVDRFVELIERTPPGDIQLAVTQLSIAIAAAFRDILPAQDFKSIHERITALDTLEEIRICLLDLCRVFCAALAARRKHAGEEVIRKMADYIEKHYQEVSLTAESVAAVVGLSPNYARAKFKEATGKSISASIGEMRFHKACELLRTTNLPAGRIAALVGFENAKYFYGAFKKHFGVTPGEYRDENNRT